jgi:replicative DNA helicase
MTRQVTCAAVRYLEERGCKPLETDAEMVVLKNRDGKVGKIKAHFNVHRLEFGAVTKDGEAA